METVDGICTLLKRILGRSNVSREIELGQNTSGRNVPKRSVAASPVKGGAFRNEQSAGVRRDDSAIVTGDATCKLNQPLKDCRRG